MLSNKGKNTNLVLILNVFCFIFDFDYVIWCHTVEIWCVVTK